MDDINIIIESLNIEQYKKLFGAKPLSTKTIVRKNKEYIDYLSNSNNNLKSLLNIMLKNNIYLTNCTSNNNINDIQFIISKNNLDFIKYVKDKVVGLNVKLSLNDSNSFIIDFKISNESQLNTLNNIINNYLTINKPLELIDDSLDYFIEKQYSDIDKNYLKYIQQINKSEIAFLKEKNVRTIFNLKI